MIFVTTYKIKPFLSKEETRELLEVFAKEGAGPGTTAHYVAADGSHGVVISETDDVAGGVPEHPELHAVGRVRHQGDADGRAGPAAHSGRAGYDDSASRAQISWLPVTRAPRGLYCIVHRSATDASVIYSRRGGKQLGQTRSRVGTSGRFGVQDRCSGRRQPPRVPSPRGSTGVVLFAGPRERSPWPGAFSSARRLVANV